MKKRQLKYNFNYILAPSDWRWARAFEVLLLTVLALVLGYITNPSDPFYSEMGFPWPWLTLVIVALYHGLLASLAAVAVYNLAFYLWWQQYQSPTEFPLYYSVGTIVGLIIIGEFRDRWLKQLKRVEAVSTFSADRLNQFTHAYHLLKVSHDQMEERIAGGEPSLREALFRVAKLVKSKGGLSASFASEYLYTLKRYAGLESAIFYFCNSVNASFYEAANLGAVNASAKSDALLREALANNTTMTVVEKLDVSIVEHDWLMAIPLIKNNGEICGVIAVEHLPFWRLNEKTVRLLAVMNAYLVDQLDAQSDAHADDAKTNLVYLRYNLQYCRKMNRDFGIESILLRGEINQSQHQIKSHMLNCMRGLDQVVFYRNKGSLNFWLLMPVTDEVEAQHFLQRFRETLSELNLNFDKELTNVSLTNVRIQ